MKTYDVTLKFETELLGTAPANPEIYSAHIATKKNRDLLKAAVVAKDTAEIERIKKEDIELAGEEAALLPADDKGVTVVRRNGDGLVLPDFMIRGFLKEAGKAISGTWGLKSIIDRWLFVTPRLIPVLRDGEHVTEADGVFQRPLRAETMQGPRVTLAASEQVNAGATVTFKISVLPLGETKGKLDLDTLKSWLDYGALQGLGQFRSGSYGRFSYTISEVE